MRGRADLLPRWCEAVQLRIQHRVNGPITFAVSFVMTLLILIVALWLGNGPRPVVSLATALLLTSCFTWSAGYLRLHVTATLVGLVFGALTITSALVFLDWSVGAPGGAELSAASFWRYTRLYIAVPAIVAVTSPVLTSLVGFLIGRAILRGNPPQGLH